MDLLKELGIKEGNTITPMVGNVSVINLAKNPIAHEKSKHIEMKFHYLRKLISEGRLILGYCRSKDQVDDLPTKGVTIEVFKRLNKNMGTKDLQHLS